MASAAGYGPIRYTAPSAMLSQYVTHLLVGAFYYLVLATFASAAAGIGALPMLAILGCGLLVGFAAPLSILRSRYGTPITTAAMVLLGSWVLPFGLSILFSGESKSLWFAAVVLGPFLIAACLLWRAWSVGSIERPQIPRVLAWSLAIPPCLVANLLLLSIGWRLVSAGAV